MIGYYSWLFVKESTFQRFKKGEITEVDFRAEDLWSSEHDKRYQSCAYVFSMVITDAESQAMILWDISDRTRHYYENGGLLELYAAGATAYGRSLIGDLFQFKLVQEGSRREDNHPLYRLELDETSMEALWPEMMPWHMPSRPSAKP